MSPIIYKSSYPDADIPQTSVFTRLFASKGPGDVGGFPGSSTAFIDAASGTTLTRAGLLDLSLRFGHGLRTHPALAARAKRGNTILIFSPNSLAWPVILFGSVAAGLRCTLANSAYTPAELKHQYTDSGAYLIVTTDEGLGVVREMLGLFGVPKKDADRRIVITTQDLRWAGGPGAKPSVDVSMLVSMEELLKAGKLEQEEKFEGPLSNETLYLCYSSGTTGKPKGVESTHRNIQSLLSIVPATFMRSGPEDIMLSILPFYHIYALAQAVHLPLIYGLPVVIQTRFEPVSFCANIEKYKATLSLIVPPVLVVLARHPAAEQYDLSTLKYLVSGAAPLGRDLVHQVKARLLAKRRPDQPLDIVQGFGMTETSPTTHLLPQADSERKIGSIGPLLPNLEARLLDDEEGLVDAGEGQPGELWLRGLSVMKGYLNNPTATANSITADGWFKTGDIAIRDAEGYYYIVDRRKELIKYKGFQVPPAELEGVLLTHPEIADAAVIGVDSVEEATELPRAYIVVANPDKVKTPEAKAAFAKSVAKWMETKVARHKFLRGGVAVIDIIPKSASGKILRRELRDRAKVEAKRASPAKAKL